MTGDQQGARRKTGSDATSPASATDLDRSAYEAIFDAVDDAVFVFDVSRTDGELCFRFRENNSSHEAVTGLRPEKNRGQRPAEFLEADQAAEIIANYRRCVERAETIEYEETLKHPSGTVEWQTKLTPIVEDGQVTQIVGVSRDVTDRKNEQRKLRAIYEASIDIGFVLSEPTPDGKDAIIRDFSPGAENLFGYETDTILGESVSVLYGSDDTEWNASVNQRLEAGETWRGEIEAETIDGNSFHTLVTAYPYHEEDRTVNLWVFLDISDRKASERELERSRDRMEFVLKEIDALIFELDTQTEQANVYPGTAHLFDDEIDQLEELAERIQPADRPAQQGALSNGLEGGEPFDIEYRVERDGQTRWIRSTGHPEVGTDGDVTTISGFARDITERKEREQALKRRDEFLQHSSDIVVLLDETGTVTYQSSVTTGTCDQPVRNLVGESPAEYVHPEDQTQLQEAFQHLLENPDEGPISSEYRMEMPDGDWRWYENRAQNYLEDPTIDGILVNIRDITKRKAREQELERTRDELQTQRDSMRLLNEVVRHDVRNDLAVIKGYAETLAEHVDEAGTGALETVREKTDEVISLTNTARELAEVMHQSGSETKRVSLSRAIERQAEEVRRDYPEASVILEEPLPDSAVEADDMLDAVFRNLLKNAVQHNDKDIPEITVTATATADSVRVRIADNGPGISEARKAEIFDKGTTGLESAGTGLGLYLVETLVDRYGGTLSIEDNEPEGAVFVVELPKSS